jgi:hypothetical protein
MTTQLLKQSKEASQGYMSESLNELIRRQYFDSRYCFGLNSEKCSITAMT